LYSCFQEDCTIIFISIVYLIFNLTSKIFVIFEVKPFHMKKTKKCSSTTLLLFFSFTVFAQQTLDLTQPEQQQDFLKYLRTQISLLQDSSLKEIMKGYKLESVSDSDKQQMAYKMMQDTAYFKRLYDYFDFMKILDNKYHISRFSNKEWIEVAQFGARNGIYFTQAMKKLMEQKDGRLHVPDYFQITPLKEPTDSAHSPKSHQE